MRRQYCECGQEVYFENDKCNVCGRLLAYDPALLTMASEQEPGSGLTFCRNRQSPSFCNWIASADDGYCLSCGLSQTIPDLSNPENGERWRKLESAKRRLTVDLLKLGLPVDRTRLSFVFKEDRRTNPNVVDDFVSTGHSRGVITINAAEADDVFREQMRVEMNEPYRTLLGHFRHEAGHFYFNVVLNERRLAAARLLFGDERVDYATAVQRHYSEGAPPDWQRHFISSYASSHPAEDWAECWAHYLHIRALLVVADEVGITTDLEHSDWQSEFFDLAVSLNEMMRALGLADAYPFVLAGRIAEKIEFVRTAIEEYRDECETAP